MSITRPLKLYPSPVDLRDWKLVLNTNLASARVRATNVDLSNFCTNVKDQGNLSSSTSFAAIGMMEFLQKKFGENKSDDIFSERFTYYATRVDVLNWNPEDCGAYIRDTIKSLVRFGTCKEATFPYNGDCTTKPSNEAYAEASTYKALSYARFDNNQIISSNKLLILDAMKSGLETGFPIMGGMNCYSNIWNAENGVIPLPNGQLIGGHAILIIGYDDATNMFKFKNSWSSSWGNNGYGYLPYEYLLSGNLFDLWTIYTAANGSLNNVGLSVVNPNADKQATVQSLQAILQSMNNTIPSIMNNPSALNNYFNDLINQYKSQNHLSMFLHLLKNQTINLLIK